MSSLKVNVTVYDGARKVETLPARPVRVTPDQRAGVVYAGEVYPLYSDNSITLDDSPVKKALCYRFVPPNSPVPYAGNKGGPSRTTRAISRWYLESNRFGHYIVFDGSHAAASDLVARVRRAGISVVRWDESVRPADNGEMFDWFVRLDYNGTAEQCRQAVSPLIQPGADGLQKSSKISAKAIVDTRTDLETSVDSLLVRVERDQALARVAELEVLAERSEDLEKSSQIAHAKSAKLERRVKGLEAQLEQQASTSGGQVTALRDQLETARSERDEAQRRSATSERMEQILDAKASAEAHWAEAAGEAESIRTERDSLALDLARLRDEMELRDMQIEELTGQLTELADVDRERRTKREVGSPQGGAYEAFVERLLPRIVLDPDDLDLLREWPSPRDAIHQLLEIDGGGRPRRSDGITRKPGWTEVRGINTGRKGKENLGRIYFHPMKGASRVRVCLHDKRDQNEQDRFIDRLPDV